MSEDYKAKIANELIGEAGAVIKPIAELAPKIYEDALTKPIQEASKILTDMINVVGAPVEIAKKAKERFVENCFNRVDKGNLVPPPLPILIGTSQNASLYDENDNLYKMFANLLTNGLDKNKIHLAHPSFPNIISQLSQDEAIIISKLFLDIEDHKVERQFIEKKYNERDKDIIESFYKMKKIVCPSQFAVGATQGMVNFESFADGNPKQNLNLYKIVTTFENFISYKQNALMYLEHLKSLNIIDSGLGLITDEMVFYIGKREESIGTITKISEEIKMKIYINYIRLTSFGKLFAESTIKREEWTF